MSQSLTINNREYIPAGEVGKHFGYTRDYILMLVRDGKIDGQKVGSRWYVNLESAQAYFASAREEREIRRQVVSEARKAELRSFEQTRTSSRPSTALLETVAILFIGLLIGATGYLGVGATSQQAAVGESGSFFKYLALSLYDLISPAPTRIVTTVAPAATVNETSVPTPETATTTYTSLVVGDSEVLTDTTIESIRDSFSDDVSMSIDPHNPDTGIIIPHFQNGDGEAYRYLIVPVSTTP